MFRNENTNQYLVLIKLGGIIDGEKIAKAFPPIKDTIDRISDCKNKVFFTSGDGGSVGFFLTTDIPPAGIKKTLYGETDIVQTACLDSAEDSVFITEVAKQWTAMGFSNGWSWLQKQ